MLVVPGPSIENFWMNFTFYNPVFVLILKFLSLSDRVNLARAHRSIWDYLSETDPCFCSLYNTLDLGLLFPDIPASADLRELLALFRADGVSVVQTLNFRCTSFLIDLEQFGVKRLKVLLHNRARFVISPSSLIDIVIEQRAKVLVGGVRNLMSSCLSCKRLSVRKCAITRGFANLLNQLPIGYLSLDDVFIYYRVSPHFVNVLTELPHLKVLIIWMLFIERRTNDDWNFLKLISQSLISFAHLEELEISVHSPRY